MPPKKRKATEDPQVEEDPQVVEEPQVQEPLAVEVPQPPAEDGGDNNLTQIPAIPEDIPIPAIEAQQQDMGALAAAAAAAVAVTQPPPAHPTILEPQQLAAAPTTAPPMPTSSDPAVSRKEKSLAVLCLNFMAVAREVPFSQDGMKIIEIQQIAEQLGAKRRRIYDIINILESVNIVERVKKNTYQWRGMDNLPAVFAVLQNEGLEEMAAKEAEAAAGGKTEGDTNHKQPIVVNGKKTKGVAKTCRKFFQIFLTTGQTHVAVSDAANIIEGPLTPANQKALTRRIYDIANVLQSCGIIEKYNVGSTSDTNKPGFRWSYDISPQEMSKFLPPEHGNALPLGVVGGHNPWSVPLGPNPTLDDPAPAPMAELVAQTLANPVELPPEHLEESADI